MQAAIQSSSSSPPTPPPPLSHHHILLPSSPDIPQYSSVIWRGYLKCCRCIRKTCHLLEQSTKKAIPNLNQSINEVNLINQKDYNLRLTLEYHQRRINTHSLNMYDSRVPVTIINITHHHRRHQPSTDLSSFMFFYVAFVLLLKLLLKTYPCIEEFLTELYYEFKLYRLNVLTPLRNFVRTHLNLRVCCLLCRSAMILLPLTIYASFLLDLLLYVWRSFIE